MIRGPEVLDLDGLDGSGPDGPEVLDPDGLDGSGPEGLDGSEFLLSEPLADVSFFFSAFFIT